MTHPAIRDLLQSPARHASFQELLQRLRVEESPRLSLSGLSATAKALYCVLLWQATERPLLVIVEGAKQAESLAESIETFFDLVASGRAVSRPQVLPALDVLPHQRLSPHSEISEERAIALWRLASERVPITVAPVGSALLRSRTPGFYRQLALTLHAGEEVPFEDVIAHLASAGYERRDPVEMVGEFSVRGGILDVFSPDSPRPVRMEFLGDLIESMRLFDPESQRSVLKVEQCALLPLTEYPKSADALPGWEFLTPLVQPPDGTLVSLLERPIVVCDEVERLREAAGRLWERLDQNAGGQLCPPEKTFLRWEQLEAELEGAAQVLLSELAMGAGDLHISTRPSMAFHGNMPVAVAEVRNVVEQGGRAMFFAGTAGELERLADIFQEYAVPFQLGLESGVLAERAYLAGPGVSTILAKGKIRRGTVFLDPPISVFGSEDLFDSSELRSPARRQAESRRVLGRPGGPQGRRLRGPRPARRGPVLRPPRDRPRRTGRRLHAARIRRGSQAVRAPDPHGPGAEVPRLGRRGAHAGPAGRRHLGAHEDAGQGQDARHGRGASQALCRAAHGRGLCLFAGQQLAAGVRRRL